MSTQQELNSAYEKISLLEARMAKLEPFTEATFQNGKHEREREPYCLTLVFCCEFPFYQPSSQSEQDQEKGRSIGVVDQQQTSSRADETTPIKSQP